MTWVMRLSKNGQAEKKGAMFMPEGTSDTKILITDEHGLLGVCGSSPLEVGVGGSRVDYGLRLG